jgi:hypothetical protein
MPRYYFDIVEGDLIAVDEEGLELPTLEAAELEATRSLANIARDIQIGVEDRNIAIKIRTDSGPLVLTVELNYRVTRH